MMNDYKFMVHQDNKEFYDLFNYIINTNSYYNYRNTGIENLHASILEDSTFEQVYTIILIILHQVFNITITLPGIAGIILSIAMAVDANVMIYERLKEELKAGKTLKTSIDLGFNKAFTAIRDSNITTIISAIILGFFGTGPIKGFAFALGMGVFLSLATSIWLTKFLLVQVMNVADTKNHWLYGA